MESDNEENKANEPQADYSRITISSLSDLEERDREHTRNMTHEQRLEYLQKLISIVYGTDLSEQEKEFDEGRICIRKKE